MSEFKKENLIYKGEDCNIYAKKKTNDEHNLFINLKSSPERYIYIGNLIIRKGLRLYVKNETPSGIFKKTNSWSFNYDIVSQVDVIDVICSMPDENIKYRTTPRVVREKGTAIQFKGYELKWYLPIEHFHVI